MIQTATTIQEIEQCFGCFQSLRPHRVNKQKFAQQVSSQMKEGYKISYIQEKDTILACIGYRPMETLAWGKIYYIDDLITAPESRGKGLAKLLLNYVKELAQKSGCHQVHLDSGYTRHAAHKTYLKCGFTLNSHHFACKI